MPQFFLSFPVYMLTKELKQAGAELEQAQLKGGFGFIYFICNKFINKKYTKQKKGLKGIII